MLHRYYHQSVEPNENIKLVANIRRKELSRKITTGISRRAIQLLCQS